MTGKKLGADDLIRLKFVKNEQGEYVDSVTFKVFTNNSHIVAIKKSGNVFGYDTVERLNIKAKMWRDLVSDEEFGRKDIITLQDPQNLESRNLGSFKYIKEGVSTLTAEQERQRAAGVNKSALGNAASVLKDEDDKTEGSRPQVGKYLSQPSGKATPKTSKALTKSSPVPAKPTTPATTSKPTARHTTGQAAASLTSTGLTPHTSSALAALSQEEYLLKPKRIKAPGYATLTTTHGPLTLELLPQHAPKAVWNFIKLSQQGYYDAVPFHRNIKGFMLQGGDPTGSGRGGSSCWGKPFADEWATSPLSHDRRGVLSMANKGKDTNTSQFFITYRACKHLDRKHTVFGRVVGDMAALDAVERVEVEEGSSRPKEDVRIEGVNVFVDPFEVFLREEAELGEKERERLEVLANGGTEDEKVTWTGKRLREGNQDTGVGKYLGGTAGKGIVVEEWEEGMAEQPVKKKGKVGGVGGFGDFEGW